MWIPVVLTYDVAHVARVAFVDSTGTQLHVYKVYCHTLTRLSVADTMGYR